MAVLTGSVWTDLLLALVVVAYGIYCFFTNNYHYWDKRGIPNVKGGFMLNTLLGRKSQSESVIEMYRQFAGVKYFGMFQMRTPTLVIKDTDLISKILVKDFTYFQDRGELENKNDPMASHLFSMKGNMWRAMRYKLTPTFSTGKLKGMFEQVSKCGYNLMKKTEEMSIKNSDFEAKEYMSEFTSEVISTCAFGLQFSLDSQDFAIFQNAARKLFKPNFMALLKFIMLGIFPKLAELLNLRLFVRKEEADYFIALLKGTIQYRRQNDVKRNDYLQLLITLQDQEESGVDMSLSVPDTSEDDAVIDQMKYSGHSDQSSTTNMKLFTDVAIASNSVVFLLVGTESASSIISQTLLELARHPEIQQKLQTEVDQVLVAHNHQWTYQTVKDMVYLDQVVQEAQRLYPILSLLMRQCTKTYKVPDSDLVIEKGTMVAIPVAGLHMDPQHYPEPEAFRPERFEGNNFKPNPAYLPYGDGPRICIAMRFAVLEVKTAIARIMAQYSVQLSPKTKLPIKMDPRSSVPLVEGGVWLKFARRKTQNEHH